MGINQMKQQMKQQMKLTTVYDQDKRPYVLTKSKLKKATGRGRFVSLKDVQNVLKGVTNHAKAGNSIQSHWCVMFNRFQFRVGCRVFRGHNRDAIINWATETI